MNDYSEMKVSPTCFSFNSEQNGVLFWHLNLLPNCGVLHSGREQSRHHRKKTPESKLGH